MSVAILYDPVIPSRTARVKHLLTELLADVTHCYADSLKINGDANEIMTRVTKNISISLDPELLAQAKKRAKLYGFENSFSAYVAFLIKEDLGTEIEGQDDSGDFDASEFAEVTGSFVRLLSGHRSNWRKSQ